MVWPAIKHLYGRFIRCQRNQRRLTLEILSSIERMADALGMNVLIVPQSMAPDLRRYIANNGRVYTNSATLANTDTVGVADEAADTYFEATPDTTTETDEYSHA
ncbi:MAG: hypothetical protein R6V42_04610 [Orrella sp.]